MAVDNIANNGGPFGVIIVDKEGKVVARTANSVTRTNDPTAHAEICAIREACKNLNTYILEGCTMYSSCEPCPMCLGAIYWSRLSKLYFGATRKDAADGGFDDDFIYTEIPKPLNERTLPTINLRDENSPKPFQLWVSEANKKHY